ncbi:ferritin-like domain-containing protein [[Eubacterium] cellulosolvens]
MGKVSTEIADLNVKELVGELNRALADEWFAIYQYWYGSLAPEQIMSPVVMEAIKKALEDEKEHAEELASRILELEGLPIRNPNDWGKMAHCKYLEPPEDLTDLKRFLADALEGERCAMRAYNEIAKMTFGKDHVTYQLIAHILAEEAEHEEMFEDLLQNLPCTFSKSK